MPIEINEAKELVIRSGKELQKTGLIARTWGNISARISDSQFAITPSGLAYETLTSDEIVTVNIADCSYEGDIKPSSEKGVHAAAYRNRPEADFVIHTHQDYATDLSTLGFAINVGRVDPEAVEVLGPSVPTAGYGLSSTKQLTGNVEKTIKRNPKSRALLMRNHGTLCIGRDYDDAFRIAHTLEEVSKKSYKHYVGSLFPYGGDSYDLNDYEKVLHSSVNAEIDEHFELFRKTGADCVIEVNAPFIAAAASFGRDMKAYVDDLAQMLGTKVRCLPADADDEALARAVSGSNGAVLLKGKGAICTGGTEDDAKAAVMVLDKNCQMFLLEKAGRHPIPVGAVGGAIEHFVYVNKYSKLRKQDE